MSITFESLMDIMLSHPKIIDLFLNYISKQVGSFDENDVSNTKIKYYNFENNEDPAIMIFKNKVIFAQNKKHNEIFENHELLG